MSAPDNEIINFFISYVSRHVILGTFNQNANFEVTYSFM